jgi:hypothetical protein
MSTIVVGEAVMGQGQQHPPAESEGNTHFGLWTRLRFCYWLACGFWVRPRVVWLARSLALY